MSPKTNTYEQGRVLSAIALPAFPDGMTGIADSYEAFDAFFSSFSLADCREHLWELYERCVMSYHSEHTEHAQSASILFFYRQMEMLVEAVWILQTRKAGRKAGEPKKRKGK
jgi:hypothetical protein